MYLEMSRDETHGGGTWSFPNCIWAPTEKDGGGSWPFWTKVLDVRAGDIILHLRGLQPHAKFVGFSRAARDGFETSKRPPDPKNWSHSTHFYRADLEEYVSFHQPIGLSEVFAARRGELEAYFDANKARSAEKLNVFYVRQAGRLQCLNGAYLSDVDEELFTALFGPATSSDYATDTNLPITVETGCQLASVKVRLGQSAFAGSIKELYGNACCFPSCSVTDLRFLVASHIARWSDNEELRGNLGNGLCLCLTHDRAFELGLFTLDERYRVFMNPKERSKSSELARELETQHGKQIKLARIVPLDDALLEHWIRADISP
jgi:hypothetical protein